MPFEYVRVTKRGCTYRLLQGRWEEIGKSASILPLILVDHQDFDNCVTDLLWLENGGVLGCLGRYFGIST